MVEVEISRLLLLIVASLVFAGALIYYVFRLQKLQRFVRIDPLTGLWNKLYYPEAMAQKIAEAKRRKGSTLALMFIDVDNFKRINDVLGHKLGDEVLVGLASVIRSNIRQVDVAGRYQGDEFYLILPETTEAAAHRVGGRIAAEALRGVGIHGAVDLSFGIILVEDGDDSERVFKRADAAMYRAKGEKKGRRGVNCVVPDIEPI